MADRDSYRNPIYSQYITTFGREGAGSTLGSRLPFLEGIIRRHFPSDRESRILDIGCGDGSFLFALHRQGFLNLVGVDVSPQQVSSALALHLGTIHHSDMASFLANEPNDSFDVVIAFDVLEHLAKDEIVGILRALQRILRKGGRLVIHVPNGGSPFAGRVLYGDFTHEVAFTQQSLSQLLLSLGYAHVTCHEDSPASTGIVGIVRRILWRFVRAVYVFVVMIESGGLGSNRIFSQNLLCIARK